MRFVEEEYFLRGEVHRVNGDKAVIPITRKSFRLKSECEKEGDNLVCQVEDLDSLIDLVEKEKKQNCPFIGACIQLACRKDWDNFICSDDCPYKHNGEITRPLVSLQRSEMNDAYNYVLDLESD